MAISRSWSKLTGNTLLIVLIFCSVISLLVTALLNSSILQVKMVNNTLTTLQNQKKIEQEIIAIEKKLKKNKKQAPNEASFLQFIPDTLQVDDKSGTSFYRIQVKDTLTTFSNYAAAKDPPDLLFALKVVNNQWVNIVATHREITFFSEEGGKLQEIVLSPNLPGDILKDIAAVDSTSSGLCDFLYINDGQDRLLKIDLRQSLPSQWQLSYAYSLPGMIGKPIVGRSPYGNKLLIYVLAKNILYAILDDHLNFPQVYFKIKDDNLLEGFTLAQGHLITGTGSKAKLFDAFTGMIVQEQPIMAQRCTWRKV